MFPTFQQLKLEYQTLLEQQAPHQEGPEPKSISLALLFEKIQEPVWNHFQHAERLNLSSV